jgi:hypothetical protein
MKYTREGLTVAKSARSEVIVSGLYLREGTGLTPLARATTPTRGAGSGTAVDRVHVSNTNHRGTGQTVQSDAILALLPEAELERILRREQREQNEIPQSVEDEE